MSKKNYQQGASFFYASIIATFFSIFIKMRNYKEFMEPTECALCWTYDIRDLIEKYGHFWCPECYQDNDIADLGT